MPRDFILNRAFVSLQNISIAFSEWKKCKYDNAQGIWTIDQTGKLPTFEDLQTSYIQTQSICMKYGAKIPDDVQQDYNKAKQCKDLKRKKPKETNREKELRIRYIALLRAILDFERNEKVKISDLKEKDKFKGIEKDYIRELYYSSIGEEIKYNDKPTNPFYFAYGLSQGMRDIVYEKIMKLYKQGYLEELRRVFENVSKKDFRTLGYYVNQFVYIDYKEHRIILTENKLTISRK